MKNTAKLFVCHHPDQILLYKSLVNAARERDKDAKIILFKVNHPYFLKFNFEPYRKFFDTVIEFDFVHYKKNMLAGLWGIFNFQKKLKKATADLLANFSTVDLFVTDSAWLPVNILLYNLARQKNIKNIIRFTGGQLECSQTKTDRMKTFFCSLYSLPINCYKIKAISSLAGKFQGFAYTGQIPGIAVRVVSPFFSPAADPAKENILPYPLSARPKRSAKKDMVIVFGDANILQCYSEYLPEHRIFTKKIKDFFGSLEDKYADCRLYYKPHPSDENRIMPGIDAEKYNLLDNTTNAEMIVDSHYQNIKAVYTFSSTSILPASFFGIPSYTFYRYLFNAPGIALLDNIFNQDAAKSKFIFHLSNLDEIGKIDNLKHSNIDFKKSTKILNKILNI